MAEPYSRPQDDLQDDLPPPLPTEPEEYNVPAVHSDPPGYEPPAPPPDPQPAPSWPPVAFTPPQPVTQRPAINHAPTEPAETMTIETVTAETPQPPTQPAAPRTRRRVLRSLFWPGFVAGFMLLAGMSCGGAVAATGISRLNLADLQDTNAAWSPPPVTPTPAVQAETPAEAAPQDSGGIYQAGDVVRNITASNVNIRATPGYLSKPDGDIVAQVRPGETVEILGNRSLADNLIWWQIRYQAPDGAVIEGWVAEATASGVQILGR